MDWRWAGTGKHDNQGLELHFLEKFLVRNIYITLVSYIRYFCMSKKTFQVSSRGNQRHYRKYCTAYLKQIYRSTQLHM